jgi:predicted 3-demethylubiquinone-9 3-methyltransferase (glyoxalase superfamily)
MADQKITPFLWFDTQAEEAANFYTETFKFAKILSTQRYDDAGAKAAGQPAGSVMTVEFEIEGMKFVALNGGPIFQFTPAISFVVDCENQEEVDALWEKLSADPGSEQCGWCKDKFGVSWQIVPTRLNELLSDPDPEKARRAMQAMLTMKKIDIAELEKAVGGEAKEEVAVEE